MALIKCIECGKEISNEAISCPYCGYNKREVEAKEVMKKLKSKFRPHYKLMFFGIILIFVSNFFGGFKFPLIILGFLIVVISMISLFFSFITTMIKHMWKD